MHVFVTGASGHIGGTVAHKVLAAGHRVSGLVRAADKAQELAALGVEPVVGGLDDRAVVVAAARRADAYLRALAEAPPGSLFYCENGAAEMRAVARDRPAARLWRYRP